MKKRIFCLLLALLMAAATLCACAKPADETSGESTQETTGETTQEESTSATETKPKNILQKSDPAEDDTLNILMIGNSFCYYFVEELQGMLAAAGIKANVCNLYYSGCTLEMHWKWWKNGEAKYEYYMTDTEGRKGTEGANFRFALRRQNWDVISLQEVSQAVPTNGGEKHLKNTETYWKQLYEYLMEQFPQSKFYWHQTWTYQVEFGRKGYEMTPQTQEEGQVQQEIFAKGICDYFDGKVSPVNSGRAWQICRTKYNYDYLTCRLASGSGKGDGYHDGDIGGGQYLNACIWFEVLTGQSCVGNTYRPSYKADGSLANVLDGKLKITQTGNTITLTEELISILQNSAHEAAAMLKA